MKYICPLIVVSDIKRDRAFYESVLGQKVKFDFGENITFHGDFAIHLKSHYEGLISNKVHPGSHGFELYFEHNQVDEMVQHLKAHEVDFIHEVREEPWGQKVMRFYDPDKNIIEVGESIEFLINRLSKKGLTSVQISQKTGMDLAFIEDAIKQFGA